MSPRWGLALRHAKQLTFGHNMTLTWQSSVCEETAIFNGIQIQQIVSLLETAVAV
jgi:hypothetical protein